MELRPSMRDLVILESFVAPREWGRFRSHCRILVAKPDIFVYGADFSQPNSAVLALFEKAAFLELELIFDSSICS